MSDGMLSVRRRKIDSMLSKQERQTKSYQFKIEKHSFKPSKVSQSYEERLCVQYSIVHKRINFHSYLRKCILTAGILIPCIL